MAQSVAVAHIMILLKSNNYEVIDVVRLYYYLYPYNRELESISVAKSF